MPPAPAARTPRGTGYALVGLGDEFCGTRRPKDAAAGAASGAKVMVKGVLAGGAALVKAPVEGARENGVKGFVQGLGMGVAGAIALPVAGTIVGCVQLTRGVLNTPEAIKQRCVGKVWDENKKDEKRGSRLWSDRGGWVERETGEAAAASSTAGAAASQERSGTGLRRQSRGRSGTSTSQPAA